MKDLISVIIPIYNGSKWIDNCFDSIINQNHLNKINVEICICNDASTDNTLQSIKQWEEKFKNSHINLKVFNNGFGIPKGVGYAKNRAISISRGAYLCFQDIDDIMLPNRLIKQYEKALELPQNTIIGSKFVRNPKSATKRYTKWANSLTQNQLEIQIFTSHGPTIIMPTWFCHRSVFDRVGGFSEEGRGTPEDLIFFYKHLDLGGKIFRIDNCLLIYTYHLNATTFSIHETNIWDIRVQQLQKTILNNNWNQFTIWNAGKQGRKLYRSLNSINKNKVIALCDVDKNKIGKKYLYYDPIKRRIDKAIDIIHYKTAKPPFVICVKIDLTNGVFEHNLNELNLKENIDYILFS